MKGKPLCVAAGNHCHNLPISVYRERDCAWSDHTYADDESVFGVRWHVIVIGDIAVTTHGSVREVEEAYRDGLIR